MKRDFRIRPHDDSPERAETVKALRSIYKYRMDYGVPVADGFRMEDAPGREWQTKAHYYQEMWHLNRRSLVRSGKRSFPGDTPQLKPLTLVELLQEKDFAGVFHDFVPKSGVPTSPNLTVAKAWRLERVGEALDEVLGKVGNWIGAHRTRSPSGSGRSFGRRPDQSGPRPWRDERMLRCRP